MLPRGGWYTGTSVQRAVSSGLRIYHNTQDSTSVLCCVSRRSMSSTVAADSAAGWRLLGTPREELRLEFTLPTGQSFRWRETGPDEYTGVVGQRVVGNLGVA